MQLGRQNRQINPSEPGRNSIPGEDVSAWSSIQKGYRLGDLDVRDAYGWREPSVGEERDRCWFGCRVDYGTEIWK